MLLFYRKTGTLQGMSQTYDQESKMLVPCSLKAAHSHSPRKVPKEKHA